MDAQVHSLYDWLGGMEALERLIIRFYEKVLEDELLKELFKGMAAEHPKHVAMFLAEVLGGPAAYSASCGGHARMLSRHFGRQITQQQRQRWVALLLETADEIKLPDDPEFRSAFVAYLEWGSRLESSIRNPIPQFRLTAQYLCRNADGVCREVRTFLQSKLG